MRIHSSINGMKLSTEWKRESNELLYSSPFSSSILKLLKIGKLENSNCFGTALWTLGCLDYALPRNIEWDYFFDFVSSSGFSRKDESILDFSKENVLLFSTGFSNEYVNHMAVYLGKSCGIPVLFEQSGPGGFFRIQNSHSYISGDYWVRD